MIETKVAVVMITKNISIDVDQELMITKNISIDVDQAAIFSN
jgi:hypothetical protein